MNKLVLKLCKKHTIVLCSQIIEEINRVTKRKFPDKWKDMDEFFTQLPYELVYTPAFIGRDKFPAIRDEHDYPILATAIMEDVDVLITGDKDFAAIDIKRPEIVTPSQFMSRY